MATPIDSLLDAFSQIDDPRKPRGVRHPYSSLLSLVFLGLLCRQTELAALQRWAEDRWETPARGLGLPPKASPARHDHEPGPGPILLGAVPQRLCSLDLISARILADLRRRRRRQDQQAGPRCRRRSHPHAQYLRPRPEYLPGP